MIGGTAISSVASGPFASLLGFCRRAGFSYSPGSMQIAGESPASGRSLYRPLDGTVPQSRDVSGVRGQAPREGLSFRHLVASALTGIGTLPRAARVAAIFAGVVHCTTRLLSRRVVHCTTSLFRRASGFGVKMGFSSERPGAAISFPRAQRGRRGPSSCRRGPGVDLGLLTRGLRSSKSEEGSTTTTEEKVI